jgi:preprotein translocase subunit YajC
VQPAPAPKGGGGEPPPSGLTGILPMLLMVVPILLLMFWSSRSQQKKQQTLLAGLAKGDRVITQSGLVGKFLEMDERVAKLEIAPGVKVEVLRSGILGKDTPETQAVAEKR